MALAIVPSFQAEGSFVCEQQRLVNGNVTHCATICDRIFSSNQVVFCSQGSVRAGQLRKITKVILESEEQLFDAAGCRGFCADLGSNCSFFWEGGKGLPH